MIRIGVIDDEKDQYELIYEKFDIYNDLNGKKFEIFNGIDYTTKEAVVEWILDEHLDCLIIDFRLLIKFQFSGVELINYIQDKLCGFACVILTAKKSDVIDTKLVIKPLIYDKDEILTSSTESKEINDFIINIQEYVEIYKTKLKEKVNTYKELMNKYENDNINDEEFKELELNQKILTAYGIVEFVPLNNKGEKIEDKLEDVLSQIKSIIKEK